MIDRSAPSRRAIPAFILATAALLLLAGCRTPPPSDPAPKSRYPAPTVYAGVSRLSPEQNRIRIDATFPPDVPVPAGKVIVGEALGTSAWDYQMDVSASVRDVVAWYAATYPEAGWELIGDVAAADGSSRRLEFRTSSAESTVVVEPVSDAESRATVTLVMQGPGATAP